MLINSDELTLLQNQLIEHEIYARLRSTKELKKFMETHIFAVWDFMSLLKSLQNRLTCTRTPWVPSAYSSSTVRMINQIVLEEESDIDQKGEAISHFELYLKAMNEVGADTTLINKFLKTLDTAQLPEHIKKFVNYHLSLIEGATTEEVAASFFYGREHILPLLFEKIVNALKKENIKCPTLIYYFERHIELDGGSHGVLAQKCLDEICGNDFIKVERAKKSAIKSLELRKVLWDGVYIN